jgi:hypothetical protein
VHDESSSAVVVLMVASSKKTSEEFMELVIFLKFFGFPVDDFLRFCEIPCTWHDKQTTGNASLAMVAAGRHVRR